MHAPRTHTRLPRHASRPAAALAAFTVLVAVTACSSSGGSEATATPDPLTAWAGGVCDSVSDLKSTVADLGDSVKIDATSSTPAADQLKAQLESSVSTVVESATGVVTAVSALPPSSDASLQDARDALKADADSVSQGIDEVKDAVAALPDDPGQGTVLQAVATVGPLVAGVALDAKQLVDAATQYAKSADAEVSGAFGDAEQCTTLGSSPSPS